MNMRKSDENAKVEIGPWLSKFPLPETAREFTVTHDMAGDWLDYRSRPGTAHQRKLSPKKVAGYTDQMNRGLWRLTPQGLIFDTDGWLFNGQHRLQAFRNSVLDELQFWVFPNQASDLFAVVDTGYGRQAHQLFQGSNATVVTSAVRYLMGPIVGQYVRSLPPAMALEAVDAWPELKTHAAKVAHLAHKVRIPASAHLAVLAQAERTGYRHRIPSWLEGLLSGTNLPAGDPRHHLRERFMGMQGQRRTTDYNYNTIVKAWNLHAIEQRTQNLSWRITEGMLSVLGTGADLSAGVQLDLED